MRNTTTAADSLNARRTNPDAPGPALILLHGAAGSAAVWPRALLELPGTHTVAIDLPGHGRSPQPGRRSVRQYADSVAQFLRDEALSEVIIAGHSMGGAVALELARRQLPGVRGLILLSSSGRLRVGGPLFAALSDDFAQAATLLAGLSFAAEAPDELRQAAVAEIIDCGTLVTTGDFLACNHFDLTAELPNIALPTLVISGTADQMVPLRYSAATAAALPNATLRPIEGAGHFVMREAPDEVALLVKSFVRLN